MENRMNLKQTALITVLACAGCFASGQQYSASVFKTKDRTYATVGTDLYTLAVRGKASIVVQGFTGIETVTGAGIVGSDIALNYSTGPGFAFFGVGLPVALDKITIGDVSAQKVGFTVGYSLKFSLPGVK